MQRKVAEQNRKPGGKKKKKGGSVGGADAAGAGAAAGGSGGGVNAVGLGLVNAAAGDSDWAKIPKKAGAKKKKPQKLDASQLGFTSKFDMALLEADD